MANKAFKTNDLFVMRMPVVFTLEVLYQVCGFVKIRDENCYNLKFIAVINGDEQTYHSFYSEFGFDRIMACRGVDSRSRLPTSAELVLFTNQLDNKYTAK